MRSLEFSMVRSSLDGNANFTNVVNTGWHADAVYERFSDAGYGRRSAWKPGTRWSLADPSK